MKIHDLRFLRNFLLLLAKLSLLPIKLHIRDMPIILIITSPFGACISSKNEVKTIMPAYTAPAKSPFILPPSLPLMRETVPHIKPEIMLISISVRLMLLSSSFSLCINADAASIKMIVAAIPIVTEISIVLQFNLIPFDDCKKIPPNIRCLYILLVQGDFNAKDYFFALAFASAASALTLLSSR